MATIDKLDKLVRFTRGFFVDPDRKSLKQIYKDLKVLNQEGSLLRDSRVYFMSLLYKRHAGELDQYIYDKTYSKIVNYYNENLGRHPVLENKIRFAELMNAQKLPHPLYLGKIESNTIFTSDGKKILLSRDKQTKLLVEDWVSKYQTIFIKPANTYGGRGIIKQQKGQLMNLSPLQGSDEKYLIEKGIVQHQLLNKINPYSVNTLRVVTLKVENQIQIPSAFLRMGVKGAYVDNLSAGGLFINYDLDSGQLAKTAYRKAEYGGKSFEKHPNTNFVFNQVELPFLERIKTIAKKAAELFSDLDIIGWDFAFTPEGPLLIEGNSNPSIITNQIILKGLKTNPYYKKYLDKQFR